MPDQSFEEFLLTLSDKELFNLLQEALRTNDSESVNKIQKAMKARKPR